jgi:plasmid stability protein
MPEIVLSDVNDVLILAIGKRAADHRRTPTDEAKRILSEALLRPADTNWSNVEEIYERLTNSGRQFGDSSVLIREDRDR